MQSNYAYHTTSLFLISTRYRTILLFDNITKLFFFFCISGLALRDYDDSLSQKVPRILTRSKTIRAAFGERVQLPCQVQDLGMYLCNLMKKY